MGYCRRFLSLVLVPVAGFIVASPAFAQKDEPPFSAERPGFTNGVETVAPGYFQFEYGYRFARNSGVNSHQIGESAQVRAPLRENSEFRIGLPTYYLQEGANGFGDTSFSYKYRFRDAEVGHFGLALIAGTTVPTSPRGVGDSYWKPQGSLEFSLPLNERWGVQASGAYSRAGRERRFDQSAVAVNLGFSVNERTSVFGETYRYVGGEGVKGAADVDTGVTLMANRVTQLDVNGGIGVSSDVRHDFFFGFGIARRW